MDRILSHLAGTVAQSTDRWRRLATHRQAPAASCDLHALRLRHAAFGHTDLLEDQSSGG